MSEQDIAASGSDVTQPSWRKRMGHFWQGIKIAGGSAVFWFLLIYPLPGLFVHYSGFRGFGWGYFVILLVLIIWWPLVLRGTFDRPGSSVLKDLFIGLAVILITATVPLVIMASTQYVLRAHHLRLATFLFSAGCALLYYWTHRERFPSVADKVTYFTGVTLAPVTIVELLILR